MAWELKGNAGTDPATNFLGTTDGKSLVIQPASGNVGVGTTRPDTRLNINSTATNAQAVLVVSDKNADTRVGLWSGFSAGGNSPAIIYTHDLRFGIGQDFTNGANFSEAMRITHDGKIGIGTQNPSSKVEIAAQDGLSVTGFEPFITLRDAGAGNLPCFIQSVNGGFAVVPQSFQGGAAPLVVLNGTGNVGIGTVKPSERLHVVADNGLGLFVEANNGLGLAVSAGNGPGIEVNSASAALEASSHSNEFPVIFAHQEGSGTLFEGTSAGFENPVFVVRHSGDVQVRGITLTSDKNGKDNLSNVNTREILERLTRMPIREWNYKTDPASVHHVGPTSQDFHVAFGLNGSDDTQISLVDGQGIALAAVQGLNEKLNAENAQLRTSVANLERRLTALESKLPKS